MFLRGIRLLPLRAGMTATIISGRELQAIDRAHRCLHQSL
jgi:hypothetical protein